MNDICKIISQVRDRINKQRTQYKIMANLSDWHRLCSALDTVEDTHSAISSFKYSKSKEIPLGERYLRIYGVLQALFTQQDAVKGIANSLKIAFEEDPELKDIRQTRTESIGHPTDIREKQGESYVNIVQMTVGITGFQYHKYTPSTKDFQVKTVRLLDIITRQEKKIYKILVELINELDKEDMEHKDKFKNKKLVDLFPPTLSYYFEKVGCGIEPMRSADFELGRVHLQLIKNIVESLREALKERDEFDSSYSLEYEYEYIEYPLNQLELYFIESEDCEINNKSANIFIWYLREKLNLLKENC